MKDLITGENTPLATHGKVRIALGWRTAPSELDVVCLALGTNGKVPSDEWFLFFNQPEAPKQAIRFSVTEPNKAEFLVDLDQLPANIDKCVFAGVLEGEGGFADVEEASIAAVTGERYRLRYQISEPFPGKALIFGEVYRHAQGWKMRAVGQGFGGGLKPLAEHYGVKVADESHAPPPPAPAPSPSAPAPPPRREPEEAAPEPPRRSLFLRLVKLCMVLILLAAGAGLAAYFYTPTRPYVAAYVGDFKNRLFPPATVIKPDQSELTVAPTLSRSANYVEPKCELVANEVFERYHSPSRSISLWFNSLNLSEHSNSGARMIRLMRSRCRSLSLTIARIFK